jgi:hypothetical protein
MWGCNAHWLHLPAPRIRRQLLSSKRWYLPTTRCHSLKNKLRHEALKYQHAYSRTMDGMPQLLSPFRNTITADLRSATPLTSIRGRLGSRMGRDIVASGFQCFHGPSSQMKAIKRGGGGNERWNMTLYRQCIIFHKT